jgi:hypothetical protein
MHNVVNSSLFTQGPCACYVDCLQLIGVASNCSETISKTFRTRGRERKIRLVLRGSVVKKLLAVHRPPYQAQYVQQVYKSVWQKVV